MSGRTIPHIRLTSIEVRTLLNFRKISQHAPVSGPSSWSLVVADMVLWSFISTSVTQKSLFLWSHYNSRTKHLWRHCWQTHCSQRTGLLPSAPTPGSKVPLTGRVAFLSRGRDRCSTAGQENPWVFRTHPGGADRAGALLSTTTIIYWVRLLVEPGQWRILMEDDDHSSRESN